MKTLANEAEFEEFLARNPRALVDFSASWCGPCRSLAPILEELSKTASGLAIATVDVDQNTELTDRFGISSVPTMLLFMNGVLISKKVGAQSIHKIKEWLADPSRQIL